MDTIIFIPDSIDTTDPATCRTYSVEELMRLESLISSISARIVKTSHELLDEEILTSIQDICQNLGMNQGGLLEVSPTSPIVRVSHAWYDKGVTPVSEDINLAEIFPWSYQILVRNGHTVAISSVDALPAKATIDQQSLVALGIKSALTIPLYIANRIHHFINVGSLYEEKVWQKELVARLRLVGETFLSALRRREDVRSLEISQRRLDLATTSAGAGVWEVDMATGVFWASDKAKALLGFSSGEVVTLEIFLAKVHPDDRRHVQLAIDQSLHLEAEINVEYRVPGTDGKIRWMNSRGNVQREVSADTSYLMGVTLEITQRKKMEQKAQEHIQEINLLRKQLEKENTILRQEAGLSGEYQDSLGVSKYMQNIMKQIRQVAATDATVLIQGETGTGKELIAKTIHKLSKQADRIMVTVNCAALPAALVESELFGRERGAFTDAVSKQMGRFELADNSTLFLDEIGEMPLETQAKLLRVLQEGQFERLGSARSISVNVRIIAASNRNLHEEVEKGRFRQDLFYRLNIFPIHVPPLRDRVEDIPQLVRKFINEFGQKMGKKISKIAHSDMERLANYAWPGNIRELRNVIEHALIVTGGNVLDLSLSQLSSMPQRPITLSLREMERQHITTVLESTRGRIKGKGGAAELLELNPSTLYSRMRKLNIKPTHS